MNKRKICVPIILLMASLLVWTGCEKEPQERKTEALTSGKTAAQQRIIFEYYFHEFMWNAIDTSVRAFNQRHSDLRLDNVALDHESFKPAITKMLRFGVPSSGRAILLTRPITIQSLKPLI
jgi:hypothetical protein